MPVNRLDYADFLQELESYRNSSDFIQLLQCFSCQTLCHSCGFDICTEGFKIGTVFNFRHITSLGYIA